VILVALGTRYQNYCANVSRTYLINPSKTQEAQYNALLKAHEAAVAALKDGAPAKAAMEAVHQVGVNAAFIDCVTVPVTGRSLTGGTSSA
jgi:Xaa-Pro aminopeptidase